MRNVLILTLAQALSAAGMMTMTLLGGILGSVASTGAGSSILLYVMMCSNIFSPILERN